jgi:hypothetical protein
MCTHRRFWNFVAPQHVFELFFQFQGSEQWDRVDSLRPESNFRALTRWLAMASFGSYEMLGNSPLPAGKAFGVAPAASN